MPSEQQDPGPVLVAGTSNPALARQVADYVGRPLTAIDIRRFSDGEIFVEVQENVRGRDVFVIQSTCAPANEHLMELLIIADALKRASASRITAVLPYYGYARQDRKVQPRTPITAKLVADLLVAAGIGRVLTMDLHAGQIQGFFNVPVDNLFATPVLLPYIQERLDGQDIVVVSPDAGGVERARAYAKRIGAGLAICDKRRPKANQAEVTTIIGDVEGKGCVLVDDMIDTAGTMTKAAAALRANGAGDVLALATHGVLSGPAIDRIRDSVITELVITDTIPLQDDAGGKIRVVSVAGILGEAISRTHVGASVSSLFI
ncbi:MAG: ribose-phosphate pyrophosphokinase [Candidatus Dadabacteria bacterium]|nr:MAG: ribose-phosphate pyrophosphokinase [Candidatus Dadabacteria bacterium]